MKNLKRTKTDRVINAISAGLVTLRAISDSTQISYKDVNATVDSLERQFRVEAKSYSAPRGQQEFRKLSASASRVKRAAFEAIHKSHPADEPKGRLPHPRTIAVISAVPEEMHTMFGIRPMSIPSMAFPSRIYRQGRISVAC